MSRILIIEDEQLLQEVYKIVLEKHGHMVAVANNGLEGLNRLGTFMPDLILLDVFMPQMDGKEFLRNFNKTENPNTIIVTCTNLSDIKTESEMISLGADKFVLKASMTPHDLVVMVNQVLAQ